MPKAALTELNAVVAVSRHKSFRKAAAELGMSPSALSHAIATLEARMGVRLFNRTTRSVSLSEAGQRFLSRVQPALREISEAMESVNELRDTPTGTLRFNTSEGAAQQILTPILLEFLARYPSMRVEVVTDGKLVDIVAGGYDAGFRLSEAVPQDMVRVSCGPPQRFVVVGTPAYFRRHPKPTTPHELTAHDCVRYRFGSGAYYHWEFEKRGQALSVEVTGRLSLDNANLMREVALQGRGLAYVTEWAVKADLAAGRLVRVLEDWTPAFPGICLYYPSHRLVPAGLRAFIGVVREVAAKSKRGG